MSQQMSGLGPELDESLARLAKRGAEIAEFRRGVAGVAVTVTAPRQVVSVTVGSGGELKGLKFPTQAYKNLTGTELATVITETFEKARSGAVDRAAGLLRPILPDGVDSGAVLRGETSEVPESLDDLRAMFRRLAGVEDEATNRDETGEQGRG